jgi:hypothetical protein
MHWFASVTVVALAVTTGAVSARAQATSPACTSEQHRQFDFWIGDWNVYGPRGKLAGRNTITRVYGGCVIREHYVGAQGYTGGSLNIYDASRDRWHQTWVDNGGLLLELDGAFRDGKMVMEGETLDSTGAVQKQRITWERLEGGKLRQHWEQSADGGGSWTTLFDGTYTRRP